jgi:hypothetical protein
MIHLFDNRFQVWVTGPTDPSNDWAGGDPAAEGVYRVDIKVDGSPAVIFYADAERLRDTARVFDSTIEEVIGKHEAITSP